MNEPERLQLLKTLRAVSVRLGADLYPDAPRVKQGTEGLAYAVACLMKSPGNVQALADKAAAYLDDLQNGPETTKGAA
jgi:hypothetical protein